MPPLPPCQRRLQRELKALIQSPPGGIVLDQKSTEEDMSQWKIKIFGPENSLYKDEVFQLQFKFDNKYPFEAPEVTFTGNNIPMHPHVYSNGHICLSILADDWSPVLSVQSVCLSIISMLGSCQEKKLPIDNWTYLRNCDKSPKKSKWVFHDDSV